MNKTLDDQFNKGLRGVRVVKKGLWFRKHKFWSEYGSSKYAINYAKPPYPIWSKSLYFLATHDNGPFDLSLGSVD